MWFCVPVCLGCRLWCLTCCCCLDLPSILFSSNLHFLGLTVLPWQATVLPQEMGCPVRAQLHPRHGTTASIAAVIFYCRWKSGTTALCAVLPPGRYYRDDPRYYRAVTSAWGLRAGRGSSNSPIPIQLLFPTSSLSLSCPRTVPEDLAGSPSPAALLAFRPVGSFPTTSSCHGTRFLPKSLSLWFVLSFLGFWGDACCS